MRVFLYTGVVLYESFCIQVLYKSFCIQVLYESVSVYRCCIRVSV